MKRANINRMKKAVEAYEKVEALLDTTYESMMKSDDDVFYGRRTSAIILDFLKTATQERKMLEGKVRAFEEVLFGPEAL